MDASQSTPSSAMPTAGPYSELSDQEVIEQILLIDKLINQNRLDLLTPQRSTNQVAVPPQPGVPV